jgi:hypothetical protein
MSKECQKNYQRQRREGVFNQLEKLNDKMDKIEELINNTNSIEIELQGESMKWSYFDIQEFIKTVGDIAMEKYNKNIGSLSAMERQKYERLDIYRKIFVCLQWK